VSTRVILSGGMAQRAALARALATRPPVLLLGEPFGALDDALTRPALRGGLLQLLRSDDRPAMLLVTHDLDEAPYLAGRVIVLGGQPNHLRLEREVALSRPRPRDGLAALSGLRERLFAEPPHGTVELPTAA
jgi:sulfonate transport system ATP-binding protein